MATWVKDEPQKKAKETSLSVDWLIEKNISWRKLLKGNIMLTNEYYTIYRTT